VTWINAIHTIGSRDQKISFYEAQIANLSQSLGQFQFKLGSDEIEEKGFEIGM